MLSSMKLVFLHGSPAVGKLTVAKALLSMVSGRLFDNHAAIDLARTVFDFGAPGFWELVHSVRCASATLSQTTLRSTKNSKKSCSDATVNCFRCSCIAPGKRRHAESAIQIELNGAK